MATIRVPLDIRFWRKVTKGVGCWLWTGYKQDGYGRVDAFGALQLAHRVAWRLTNGHIPENQCVLHRCDNPSCVNPDHLFLGSQVDNMADMKSKGRADRTKKIKGVRHGSAKLTEEQVRQIRAASGMQKDIAIRFGISRSHVGTIRRLTNWAHLG